MYSGLVMSIEKEYAIVLTDTGAFQRIHLKSGLEAGQKIYFFEEDLAASAPPGREQKKERRFSMLHIITAAAVMLVAVFGLSNAWQWNQASQICAAVTVDINPSIQFEINRRDEVIQVTALNKDAANFDPALFHKKKLADALESFVGEALAAGFIHVDEDPLIRVAVVPLRGHTPDISGQVHREIKAAVEKSSLLRQVSLSVVEGEAEALEASRVLGVPLSDYLIGKALKLDGAQLKQLYLETDKQKELFQAGDFYPREKSRRRAPEKLSPPWNTLPQTEKRTDEEAHDDDDGDDEPLRTHDPEKTPSSDSSTSTQVSPGEEADDVDNLPDSDDVLSPVSTPLSEGAVPPFEPPEASEPSDSSLSESSESDSAAADSDEEAPSGSENASDSSESTDD